MEKEFITADWLKEQGFRQTDTRGREFIKQIGERICDVHQNPISLAWCFATFSDELHHLYGMRNNQGYPLNYQKELKNLAPSFFFDGAFKNKIMAKLKINEAIAQALLNGKKVAKKDIAARLWPDSSLLSRRANMMNLCTGKTDKINPKWIEIICEMTGCDANFLLDIKK